MKEIWVQRYALEDAHWKKTEGVLHNNDLQSNDIIVIIYFIKDKIV